LEAVIAEIEELKEGDFVSQDELNEAVDGLNERIDNIGVGGGGGSSIDPDALKDFVTEGTLSKTLESYATVDHTHEEYATKEEVAETYATKKELENASGASDLNIENGRRHGSIQQKGYKDDNANDVLGAIASGEGAVAFGGQRFDKVGKPVSEEPQTEAKGKQSLAAGGGCITTGAWGVSLGKENLAYQKASFAMGGGNQAGYDLKRYQDDNGYDKTQTDCDNAYSFAFVAGGERNKAVGYASFSTGSNNLSRHTNSFTSGQNNEALGRRSTVFGYCNYTYSENGFVVGQYNVRNDDALFQVGNGTGTGELRDNAFEVLKDGRAKVYGAPTEANDVARMPTLNSDGVLCF
jgi:hypothetical protein